ncbi:MAG: glycosyltransferase family 2 protein [Pseudomonadota bacterium]
MTAPTSAPSASGAPSAPGDPPLVTAIVGAWSAAEFLTETLDSLAAQTWPNLEILIADDASPDATYDVAQAWAAAQRADGPQVRVLRRERNLGWPANLNRMAESEARGEMMFWAFHDDLVEPDYVEALARLLLAEPRAALAYSDMERSDLDGTVKVWTFDAPPPSAGRAPLMGRLCDPDGFDGAWGVPNRGLFRASAFRRAGGMRRHAAGAFFSDWAWLMRMAGEGVFVREARVLCRKRYMDTSVSMDWDYAHENCMAVARLAKDQLRETDLGRLDRLRVGAAIDVFMTMPGRRNTRFWDTLKAGDPQLPYRLKLRLAKVLRETG